jgi:hypothetical protein
MSTRKRVVFFAIGLLIGIVFVQIIFDKKDVSFDYLPNDRVLKTLRTKQRQFDQKALSFFKEEGIDTSKIEYFLKESEVNFNKSRQREKPCNFYHIESKHDNMKLGLEVKNCDTLVTIKDAFKIIEK